MECDVYDILQNVEYRWLVMRWVAHKYIRSDSNMKVIFNLFAMSAVAVESNNPQNDFF